jgi:hypothetical protein
MRRALPDRFCCDADLCWIGSDGLHADEDLDAWRRGRLYGWTRELTDVLIEQGVQGLTVLDIGAGVGAVHLSLLAAGAARAIDVDASREYLAVASAEAERRGLAERVEHRFGDVVELAGSLPPADVVVLDSVICCYPYLDRLLAASLASRPALVGLTLPRNTWWMVVYMRLHNLRNALTGRHDDYFIHPYARVVEFLADAGYTRIHDGGSRIWRVVAFRHAGQPGSTGRAKEVTMPTIWNQAGSGSAFSCIRIPRWSMTAWLARLSRSVVATMRPICIRSNAKSTSARAASVA